MPKWDYREFLLFITFKKRKKRVIAFMLEGIS